MQRKPENINWGALKYPKDIKKLIEYFNNPLFRDDAIKHLQNLDEGNFSWLVAINESDPLPKVIWNEVVKIQRKRYYSELVPIYDNVIDVIQKEYDRLSKDEGGYFKESGLDKAEYLEIALQDLDQNISDYLNDRDLEILRSDMVSTLNGYADELGINKHRHNNTLARLFRSLADWVLNCFGRENLTQTKTTLNEASMWLKNPEKKAEHKDPQPEEKKSQRK